MFNLPSNKQQKSNTFDFLPKSFQFYRPICGEKFCQILIFSVFSVAYLSVFVRKQMFGLASFWSIAIKYTKGLCCPVLTVK